MYDGTLTKNIKRFLDHDAFSTKGLHELVLVQLSIFGMIDDQDKYIVLILRAPFNISDQLAHPNSPFQTKIKAFGSCKHFFFLPFKTQYSK